jgi:hypothetical protein
MLTETLSQGIRQLWLPSGALATFSDGWNVSFLEAKTWKGLAESVAVVMRTDQAIAARMRTD